MTTTYRNKRTYRPDYCYFCHATTPFKRINGDYITVPAWRCVFCKIEIVIDLFVYRCHPAEAPATPESVAREGEFYAHWLGVK